MITVAGRPGFSLRDIPPPNRAMRWSADDSSRSAAKFDAPLFKNARQKTRRISNRKAPPPRKNRDPEAA